MAEMKVTLTVDSEPVRSVLREAADAMSAAARDIGTLLAQIDALQEATGEALEAEDAALVSHIRQAWSGFQAPQEHDGPTYLDFITPDEVFAKGPDAVASWQAAKRADIMNTPPPPENHTTAYRLLSEGEIVQKGDQPLNDDCVSWGELVGWEIGIAYYPSVFVPIRRAIATEGKANAG